MKIAVPTRANAVDDHFGYCLYFTIFTAESGKIIEETVFETISSPGHRTEADEALSALGVNVLLAGEVNEYCRSRLASSGIKVIMGCQGDVREVTRNYLAGSHVPAGYGW
ncbi:MAG: NifB/NifX family molybdenum-iron cluster-binding protein [Bacteroidota bacterium]